MGFYDEISGIESGYGLGSMKAHLKAVRMPDWETIAHYMDECFENENILVATMGVTDDVLSPTGDSSIHMGVMTDGVFAWPIQLCYYVRRYPLWLPEAFCDRARRLRIAPRVDTDHHAYEW